MTDQPYLVAGLGNPGPEYAGHRHNVGFMVADLLAERVGGRFKAQRTRSGVRAEVLTGRLDGRRVVLVKPQGYMNLSGGAVLGVRDFYDVPPTDVIVVHDELDLPFGTLRLKRGGGDNGHNGLRSVTKSIGPDYLRVRFGIGRPPGRQDPADYVLENFSKAECRELPLLIDRSADAVEALLSSTLPTVQNTFHSS